jgi:uncharacterized membrane protein
MADVEWRLWRVHGFWMLPLMTLFLVLVCGLIFMAARRPNGGGPHCWSGPARGSSRPWGDPTHSALQILSERFARGEIQKGEYAEKKAALQTGGVGSEPNRA